MSVTVLTGKKTLNSGKLGKLEEEKLGGLQFEN